MSPFAVQDLASQLRAIELPVRIDAYDVIWVEEGPISVFITQRPHYCDRGRWLVHAESTQPHKLCIDHADGFPRYYFFNESLVREFGHWFALRLGQYDVGNSVNRTLQELGCLQEPE